jgi:L-ascorbate metabolism protein UlaG (beta-lactamase superfamily)
MDIQYYGANCVRLLDKKASVLIDDNLKSLGLKSVAKPEEILVYTIDKVKNNGGNFLIQGPGEYEISDISIRGLPARAHIDEDGIRSTMYSIQMQNFNIGILGHVHPDLSDEQLEQLGVIDVLITPVGGNGYTLDANAAAHLIKKIEPKIVIPTHYADPAIKYEVAQADLSLFMKEMGIAEYEEQSSLKLKESELGDKTRVVVLKRAK